MSRHNQPGLQAAAGLVLIGVVYAAQRLYISHFKVIAAMLYFRLEQDVVVGYAGAPIELPYRIHPLQCKGNTIQSVGNLYGDRVQVDAAGLLKVGELGDLLPIQPHFPAETPCAQGRAFPVILHVAQVVHAGVDADVFQALFVQLLRIAGVRLQDHLQLVKELHPVRVFAKATIVRPDRRLHIDNIPGFRTQDTQRGRRVHCSRPNLDVIRVPDDTALRFPEIKQPQDHVLVTLFLTHPHSFRIGRSHREYGPAEAASIVDFTSGL